MPVHFVEDSKDYDNCIEAARSSVSTPRGSTDDILTALGYKPELRRRRGLYNILFQVLAIIGLPFAEGSPIFSAIYGGGQLAYFVGWIVVCLLYQCIAMSLAELASRFPTSAGPYYWSYQLAEGSCHAELLSFVTGWTWLVGNWTIALPVNFGVAALLAGSVTIYHPEWSASDWHLLLILYAICLGVFLICAFGNMILPHIDTAASLWNLITILVVLFGLSRTAGAGRHSVADTLGYYDNTLSGWHDFSFFIGLLPAAYTMVNIGLIASMAEECESPSVELPKAMALTTPICGAAGLFFILPICATLPPLHEILARPAGQGLPYIFTTIMESRGGGLALTIFVIGVGVFSSISITVAASRTTWAFARDKAIPFSNIWSTLLLDDVPIPALGLVTVVQLLLGLILFGSKAAFTAFISAAVIALAASYGIPILISVLSGRRAVRKALFCFKSFIGWTVNIVALVWISFQLVLFSMPTTRPVYPGTMNWASVVFVGFMAMSIVYYVLHARKVYNGPPISAGLL